MKLIPTQNDFDIEKTIEKIENLEITYSTAKANYLLKLKRNYDLLETRNEKDKFIFAIDIRGNWHLLHIDPWGLRSFECICNGSEAKEKCKDFSKEMEILQPQIKETFRTQIAAAKSLLHHKRRLNDLQNKYEHDPCDYHYF